MSISLNRIILFVQQVAALKGFYQENFQFELVEEIQDEWVVLRAGHCELALHKSGPLFAHHDGIAASVNNNVKLVFEITADLHQLRDTLIGNNVSMKAIKSFDDIPYLFCDGMDTEGNVFQLMQRLV